MKFYKITIYKKEDKTTSEFCVYSKDKLNAIKYAIEYLIYNKEYNIDDIDIQNVEEVIENGKL